MTFDPSLRLKDALGVGDAARDGEVGGPRQGPRGRLFASLLDAKRDLRSAGPAAMRRTRRVAARILRNRFYTHLSGTLAGRARVHGRRAAVRGGERGALRTGRARHSSDAAGARFPGGARAGGRVPRQRGAAHRPEAVVRRGRSPAAHPALRPVRAGASRRGSTGVVGLGLLRDMAEFFLAFGPLYEGFRSARHAVDRLLRSPRTMFVLVTRPGRGAHPGNGVFRASARRAGHRLGPVVVNMRHPETPSRRSAAPASAGGRLMAWLGERDTRGVGLFRERFRSHPLVDLPLFPTSRARRASSGRGSRSGSHLVERVHVRGSRACGRCGTGDGGTATSRCGTTREYRLPLTAFGKRTGLEPRRADLVAWYLLDMAVDVAARTCGPPPGRATRSWRGCTRADYLDVARTARHPGAGLRRRPLGRAGRRGDAQRAAGVRRDAGGGAREPRAGAARPSTSPVASTTRARTGRGSLRPQRHGGGAGGAAARRV